MARNDDEKARYQGYGSPYLTPGQELMEGRMGDDRVLAARLATNPLAQRDAAALAGPASPVSSVVSDVSPVTAVPNPLIRPPVPLAAMGTEQRIAWERLQNEQEQDQMAREEAVLKAEADRRTRDLQREETRQSTAMLSEGVPKLQQALLSGNDDEYLAVKADLLSRFPVGAGNAEAARALKAFDDRYSRKADLQGQIEKDRIARQEAAKQRREETILKQAWDQGPEVAREVAARLADPLKGADDASSLLAQVQEKSVVQSLKDANPNLTDQDIAQKYGTGRDFNFQAARTAPKSRAFLTAERNKIGNEVMALEKMRETGQLTETWSEENQQILDEKRAYWKSLTPQIGDRAGVQGMSPGAMQVAQQQAFNYATTPAPPVRRSAVPPQRVPITQQQQIRTPTVSAAAAKPSPTPAPPPLNPAYPEQWRGGKRYVQVNGQWYLSKVQ